LTDIIYTNVITATYTFGAWTVYLKCIYTQTRVAKLCNLQAYHEINKRPSTG